MRPALKKRLIKVIAGIYLLALVVVGAQLFFGNQVAILVNYLNPQKSLHGASDELIIGYAFKPSSFEPTLFDSITRSYLADVYEGLVMTDKDLKIQPALAVSWGLVDPLTWDFRLRPGVKFHNGAILTPEDVVSSLDRSRRYKGSQLRTLLNSIESVEASGSDHVIIRTKAPDPLLLSKLAVTYVLPAGYTDIEKPVGTGPYKFSSIEQFATTLEINSQYWGSRPFYQQVELKYLPNRADRIAALEKNEIDLLANVPPNYACSKTEKFEDAEGCMRLENPDIVIKSIPSLEVSFLVFNHNLNAFRNQELHEAVAMALDQQTFVNLAFGFARPVAQFVSNGVFGFNSAIKGYRYDLAAAKNQLEAESTEVFEIQDVVFDYPEELQTIGQYVQDQFNEIGLTVTLNPLNNESLLEKIMSGGSDMYFLGWRSELGDSFDFLQAVAHTKDPDRGYGEYNSGTYSNAKVDELIESSQENLDPVSRLSQLQEVMKIIVEEDTYGVPLFESEIIYGFNNNIKFEPRVDGAIHASEISG